MAKALLFVLVFAAGAQAQSVDTTISIFRLPTQLNIMGSGSRAFGMGGAFYAVSDDASAVTWNPAGLYVHQKPKLGLQWSALVPRGKFLFGNDVSFNQTETFNNLGMFSFVAPLRIKGHHFVGSLSFTRVEDQYDNVGFVDSIFFDPDGLADAFDTTVQRRSLTNQYRSGLEAVNLGFGTRISEKLAIGLALNIQTGKAVDFSREIRVTPNTFKTNTDPQSITETLEGTQLDSTRYSGVNLTVGAKYDHKVFSVGATVRAPYTLELEIDRRLDLLRKINGLVTDSGTVHFDNTIWQIEMPAMLVLGVAIHPNEKFLWAADFEYRAFGSTTLRVRDTLVIIPGDKDREVFTEFDPEWRNVFTVRSGVEYILNTGSEIFPIVPIRAGFSILPLTSVDNVTAIAFSLGTGVRWSQIHLDAAWRLSSSDFSGTYRAFDGKQLSLEQQIRQHEFRFTFTGTF